MNPSTFSTFGDIASRIGATTKRLEKATILGGYLSMLDDTDLVRAARFYSGQAFPLSDQRTTNVGGAALIGAVVAVSGIDDSRVRERLVALGDLGDVAAELWPTQGGASDDPITLREVEGWLERIAATAGSKKKAEFVTQLLRRAGASEARFLVKLLSGDLRIGLREGAVEDAIARLAGATVGEVQWVNMLTGDIGETALLARQGRLGDAKMRLFHPLKFMLATAAADLADVTRQMPGGFFVEDKYDGIRAQAHIGTDPAEGGSLHGHIVAGTRVALFSRTLDDITESFPDLLGPLMALGGAAGLILDGEIVPVSGPDIRPFQDLQRRLGRKAPSQEMQQEIPVSFIVYDVLHTDGEVTLTDPLRERRRVLESLSVDGQRIRVSAARFYAEVAPLDAEFDAARARNNEGLMVKEPGSPYRPGKRGREWLKIKRAIATLDVVVTAVEVGNGRRSRFLSDFTFAVRASAEDPTLLNVGKAYSGLTDEEIAALSEWFRAHTLQEFAHGKVRIVEPKIVIEVTFDRVQPSNRHKGGYALRFPRIVRLRPDKPVAEIDTLDAVRKLAEEGGSPPPAED